MPAVKVEVPAQERSKPPLPSFVPRVVLEALDTATRHSSGIDDDGVPLDSQEGHCQLGPVRPSDRRGQTFGGRFRDLPVTCLDLAAGRQAFALLTGCWFPQRLCPSVD